MHTAPLFLLERIGYTYKAVNAPAFTALREINLTIQHGEFVAIIGASGSGKSTLMHLLGLMCDPSDGRIQIAGQSTKQLHSREKAQIRNEKIGFLFQQFFLLPNMSVLENILLPAEYSRGMLPDSVWRTRALELIEQFGLNEQMHKRPSQLSGGQRQRVALCRALLLNPDVLLCDEPTGALDSATAKEVLKTLQLLNAAGKTIIVITHDPEVAAIAKRTIRIADGQVVSDQLNPIQLSLGSPQQENEFKKTDHKPSKLLSPLEQWLQYVSRAARHLFRPTLQSLVSQRLRTILTMTGLLLGVTSIFIMLTLTGRVSLVFKEFFETQGARKAYVSFDWRQADRTGAPRWRGIHIQNQLPGLNQQLKSYGRVDASIEAGGCKIISTRGNFQGALSGLNSLTEAVENGLRIASGRLPLPEEFSDQSSPARVALLGSDAVTKLFPKVSAPSSVGQSVIGETITIRGCSFEGIVKIIGILKPQDSLFDRNVNSSIYVPTHTLLAGGVSPYDRGVVAVPNANVNPTWFAKYVVAKLKLMTGDRFPFRYFASDQELEKFNLMLGILTGLTLVIGGLCTLIGGVGVMNIMLVNVHERLQEIGIRKAVGARDADIRGQFLLESTGLCVLSGIIGILLGVGLSVFALEIAKKALPQVESLTFGFDPTALIAALGVSLGAGLIFGTWPARRAADLAIVDALRQE